MGNVIVPPILLRYKASVPDGEIKRLLIDAAGALSKQSDT